MAQHWTTRDIPSQQGKRAIVTGANIGLGFQTARELARAGAQVVLACRSVERGEAAAARIRSEIPTAQVFVAQLDLSSQASVRAFAGQALSAGEPLHILVNNAGIMALPQRQVTADGFELQLATNYLGHFALTGLLLPLLLKATDDATPATGKAPARVVSLSSNAHQRGKLHFGDFQLEHSYSPWSSYSQTKLAMLVYAIELQRQSALHGNRLLSFAAHPGLSSTSIGRDLAGPQRLAVSLLFKFFGQSDAQGALPQLYAATMTQAEPGAYYGPDGFKEFKGYPALAKLAKPAQDPSNGPRLWSVSEQLTGVDYQWE
jgi:NAD(P)-dependent dehydrogenase (short-subunit alcohol dehydrogenase family)